MPSSRFSGAKGLSQKPGFLVSMKHHPGFLGLITVCLWLALGHQVYAAQLTNRQVQISTATPSAVAAHAFSLTYPTTNSVGSVVFLYCINSPLFSDPCTAPAGINVATASLSSQSGNVGFSIDNGNTTANRLVLTRPSSPGLTVASSYNFNTITNPSAGGTSIFVRISTHISTDGTGSITDNGAVAFATIAPFDISTFVPPFLRLCVAITVAPDCSSGSGDSINLGNLTPSAASAGASQLAAATNSNSGYAVYALGTTMTSGNNIIPALSSPTPSLPGNSQFGINLRANNLPPVGQDPFGAGSATPTPNYNIANFFMFQPGDMIASDSQPTDYNRMTVSYLVNVSAAQPPGVYNTTFTYLAVAQF